MAALSRYVVIKSTDYDSEGYAHRREEDDLVVLGEESALSPLAKIEAERAKVNRKYVHLRFCSSNKYWARKADDDRSIVAESNQPEEDTSKSSCTLFEAVVTDEDKGLFYFTHVQSGGRLSIDERTMGFVIEEESDSTITDPLVSAAASVIDAGFDVGFASIHAVEGIIGLPEVKRLPEVKEAQYLSFLDWDTLVKLPKNVAFKGFNDNWLGGIMSKGVPYLQYSVDDPNTPITTYKIQQLPDGHVRIYSNYFNKYCRRGDSDWVVADSSDATYEDDDTLFWPVKINNTTIALRNAGNDNFCVGLDAEGKTRCLNASAPNITKRAEIVVEELVLARHIYDVIYRMEDSRIFNEKPFVAGTTTVFNYSDSESEIEAEVGYEDEKSYSFSRSLSLTAGVTSSIEFGIPLISKGSISVSYEINTTLEWDTTTTSKVSVKALGRVPVPPKSKAIVHYVATMGTCDVPFTYTQQDKRSTDGKIIYSDLIDGVFRGVNAYNFSFVVDKTIPLADKN